LPRRCLHGHEAALGGQQPDDQWQQGEADDPDTEESVLPVTKPASQQTADHPARDASQGVGRDIDADGYDEGTFAELFPHVGNGGGGQPCQQDALQDAQAHQHIKVGDPGDAQGEQDGGRQGPQHDPPPSEPISQTGTDEQGACQPCGTACQRPAGGQGADRENLCQERQQGMGLVEIEEYQEGAQAESQGGAYPFATTYFNHMELSRRLLCRVVRRNV